MADFQIAAKTKIGFIALKVLDLQAMCDFYTKIVGLNVLKQAQDTIYLGMQSTRTVFLTLRKVPQDTLENATSGFDSFSLALADMQQLGLVLRHLQDNHIELTAIYETTAHFWISVMDPEHNQIDFSVTKHKRQQNAQPIEGRQPIAPKIILDQTTGSTTDVEFLKLSRVRLSSSDLDRVGQFYIKNLGFTPQNISEENNLFLTTGKDTLFIHLSVGPTPAAKQTRLDFINLCLPEVQAMTRIIHHFQEIGFKDYHYLPEDHYLMLADPNNVQLWFSTP